MYRNLRIVYITTENQDEASSIGSVLVEKKLAACVNIIPGMQSIYRWKGKVEKANETILIVKTHSSQIKTITELVKSMHSYSCPCIVTLPIAEGEGNEDYLEWLKAESLDKT